MAKNFYAVKKGKNTGIFNSWAECKAQVEGFSGAEYKGFDTEQEAQCYIENIIPEIITNENKNFGIGDTSEAKAYVDGSYNSDTNEFS